MRSVKTTTNENAGPRSEAMAAGHNIQCSLTIGAVNDPLEQEADAMADKVMRMPAPANNSSFAGGSETIQRKCAECEEEDKTVQRKPLAASITPFIQAKGAASGNANDNVVSKINSTKGSGNEMDGATKSFMENRFGTDLSEVKIHTGDDAAEMSREMHAQAFTVGKDIYFNSGKYNPLTNDGKHLLAHELTHTVQQGNVAAGKIQKRDMQFNPSLIAQQLREAMEGLGTDEAAIYAALGGRTDEQVAQISAAYATLTGRQLQADLEDELTKSELLTLAQYSQTVSANPEERAMAVAIQLRDAMAGWGTDENAIYVALQGRSEAELELIKTAYFILTGRQLMDDLSDELNEEELNMAKGTMGIAPSLNIQNTELGMLSMGNFDFKFNNCQIEIEVRVKFQFTDDIAGPDRNLFKPRFINAVHSKWQHSGYKLVGGISCPCEDVPITVNVKEDNSNYHKLVDVEDKTEEQRRPMVVSDINVNLNTSSDTFMHEFGHVLGLYDEYDGGFWENIMFWHRNRPDDPGSLMNGVNADRTENTEAALRPRFFEHYRRAANQTAPTNCNYVVTH